VEVKLTLVLDAAQQLDWLYLPLCQHIWPNGQWRGAVICQNWVGPPMPLMLSNIAALGSVPPGSLGYLHLPMAL
jgi:hypothetical protein